MSSTSRRSRYTLRIALLSKEGFMFTNRRVAKASLFGTLVAATIFVSAPVQAQAPAKAQLTPRQQQLRTAVDEAYARFKDDTKGKNADYIPYLAQVD